MVAPSLSRTTIDARRQILRLLLSGERLSRAELARRTGLNKPTVSNLVGRMLEEGIVVEVGSGVSTGGRRPILLTVPAESRLALGVEIDRAECRVALVNLRGTVLRRSAIPPKSSAIADVIGAVMAAIAEVRAPGAAGETGGDPGARLLGCGLAVPGLVDPANDTVDCRASLGWSGVPIRALLTERLDLPVLVTDRGKAAGLGELWSLGRERAHDLIYLYLGGGVGGAILLGREIQRGVSNFAGEIGHMTIDPDGPLCACGNRGCLEAHVSIPAIIRRLEAAQMSDTERTALRIDAANLAPHDVINQIGELAAAGDPVALSVVGGTARWLGIAIAGLINALNPAAVVLGGPTAEWGEVLVEAIEREIELRTLPLSRAAVRITTGKAGDLAPRLGAAVLVLQSAADLIAQSSPSHLSGSSEQQWYSVA